jgi:hypothetical protein
MLRAAARFAEGHDKHRVATAANRVSAASLSCKLAGFAGPGGTEKDKRGSQLIYDNLRKWSRSPPKYLGPGMSADAPGGLKAYVLGPPRDTKLLLKSLPSSGANKETYFGDEAGPDEQHEAKEQSPFARRHHWKSYWDIQRSKAKNGAESYVRDLYFGSDDRRIDDLHAVEFNRLSIKMDSNTNNTSLVLAFELPDGATMIFAADAQVGLARGGTQSSNRRGMREKKRYAVTTRWLGQNSGVGQQWNTRPSGRAVSS